MKKIKIITIITEMSIGGVSKPNLEDIGFWVKTPLDQEEMNFLLKAFNEKKELKLTIKDDSTTVKK